MSETVRCQQTGEQFLIASVIYHSDVAHDGGRDITLAYVAELVVQNFHGLGLVARKQLMEDELACMDDIGKRLYSIPFDYLHGQIDQLWTSASPGSAILELSQSHWTSLRVVPPTTIAKPQVLDAACNAYTASMISNALMNMLEGYRDEIRPVAYQTFFEEAA